jgi:hypothetical protein
VSEPTKADVVACLSVQVRKQRLQWYRAFAKRERPRFGVVSGRKRYEQQDIATCYFKMIKDCLSWLA